MTNSDRLRSVGPWLVLASAYAAMLAWTWGTWPDVQIDFGREVYGAWRLAQGDVLQRDLAWLQGPLSVHWNALVFRAFGASLWALFVANMVLTGALIAVLFTLLRGLFGTLGGLAGALVFVLVFACSQLAGVGNYNFIAPYSHELTHGVGLALGALALVAWNEREPRGWKPIAAGALTGAVALTKAEPAFALAVSLALVFLRERSRRGSQRFDRRLVAPVIAAFLALPVLLLLVLARDLGLGGALQALAAPYANLVRGEVAGLPFYQQLAGIDDLGANAGRVALHAGGLAAFGALLFVFPRFVRPRSGAPRTGEQVATLVVASLVCLYLPVPWLELLAALPLVSALALVLAWRSCSRGALGLFAFGLALTAKIALACSARHYGFALAMPGTVACVAALAASRPWQAARFRGYGPNLRMVALGAVVAWCGAHLGECSRWLAIKTVPVGTGADAFLADDRGTFANRALELIRTETKGPLVVLPEGALLNFLARRQSPVRVVNFLPPEVGLWGEHPIAQELALARPRYVVTWLRNLAEYGFRDFGRDFAPEIGSWLATFRTVATLGDPESALSGRLVELRETKRLVDNVVLISIDTLRPDRLGCYGSERGLTPNLDKLAACGVVFERAYAAAPWTLPSHASLFTSEWPHATGVGTYQEPGHLVSEVVTLAEVLRAAGLGTTGITGGGYLSDAFGLERGFEHFGGDMDHSSMGEVVQRASDWLDARAAARTFFLFLHTWEVHQYGPPASFRERWVRPYSGPLEKVESLPLFLQQNRWQVRGEKLSEADLGYAQDCYDACVASVDSEIGRLLERLRAHDLLERTLIVVLSDHGEEFLEHGSTGHGYSLYEENVRVPLLLVHPALAARRVARPVSLVDLAPTLAALVGVEAPACWRGRDLLADETERAPRFLGAAHRPFVGAVSADAKVIVATHRDPACEAFELGSDPAEQHPAAPGPEHLAQLEQLLDEYLVGARRGRPVESDPKLSKELEALGYAGAGAGSSVPNPAAVEVFRARIRALLTAAARH